MAHNLDVAQDGRAAYVGAREDAWHRLGTTLPAEFNAEEALRYAYLGGWNVRTQPVFTAGTGGELVEVPGSFTTVRDNPFEENQVDVLGTVGSRYHPIQNEAHVELLDTLVDESGAHFSTAGALNGGRQVFISMKLPGHILIGGEDQIDNYLVAVNSHDGSKAFSMMVTPVRVVCENTLNLAWANHSQNLRVRHTLNSTKGIVAYARQALDMTFDYIDGFQAEANRMVDAAMTQREFDQLISEVWGVGDDAPMVTQTRSQNRLEEMSDLFAAQTQEGIKNTVWGGFNAITEWADHFSGTRSTEDPSERRAMTALFSPETKTKAMKAFMAAV